MVSNSLYGVVVARRTCNAKVSRSIRDGGNSFLHFFSNWITLCG